MIHYTTIPLEIVMDGIDQMEANYVDIAMNGVTIQVQPLNTNQAMVIRLMSGNPQDYLNPRYTPGRIIELRPVL